jgi:hypothetical protein
MWKDCNNFYKCFEIRECQVLYYDRNGKALAAFIKKNVQCRVSLSSAIIQEEAISLYAVPFTGSKEWFQRFKKHANLHNVNLQRESASDNKGATNLIE